MVLITVLCTSSFIFSQISRTTDPASFSGPSPAVFSSWTKLDDVFIRLRLKKKAILPLFKDKSETINKFVNNNKLSFKKDNDLKKIFDYFASLN